MLPGHDGSSNIVYKEDGTIYCYDKVSDPPVRHQMAYIGYEPDRETLKYRCPAKHEGRECPMSTICNADKPYGKTVRVDRHLDPRFPVPAPRHQEVRADVQGADVGGACQCAVEGILGRGRRQSDGVTAVRGPGGCRVGRPRRRSPRPRLMPRREGTLGKQRLSPIAEALRAAAKAKESEQLALAVWNQQNG